MADRMLSYCSSRQRTRKWTTRTIMHLFDLAISNSWLCYREDKIKSNIPLKKVAQLRKYKMDYGEYLIESNSILSDSEDSEYLTDEEVTPGRNPKELPSIKIFTFIANVSDRRRAKLTSGAAVSDRRLSVIVATYGQFASSSSVGTLSIF
ncbi:hypothetical protein J6590_099953 [Homalodisca vitripennis]|nr:hypothetical protein J6590_099953 [Homalodisca vitripennis]